jgi:hypothetical protein
MARTLTSHKRLILFTIFTVYLLARVFFSLPAYDKPRQLGDTNSYMRVSRSPLSSHDFWSGGRPFVFPLLLKITGQDIQATAAVQLGLSIVSWGALAWVLASLASTSWLALLSFSWMLLLSLIPHLAGWDFTMLSESLSISFSVLFVASGLWLLRGWRWYKVAVMCAAGVFMGFTRDTNIYLLLILAILLLASVLLGWTGKRALVLAAVFMIIFLLGNASANMGERWVSPLINIIGRRVLRDLSAQNYMESCGMPVTPELMRLRNEFASGQEGAFYNDPAMEGFRTWLLADGKGCYMRLLLSDPFHSLSAPLAEFNGLIAFPQMRSYIARQFDPLLPYSLEPLFYPVRNALWVWIVLTITAIIAIIMQAWEHQPLWSMFLFLSLTIFPHIFITWHGDALVPQRHAMSVGLQLSLCLWILAQLLLDQLSTVPAGTQAASAEDGLPTVTSS